MVSGDRGRRYKIPDATTPDDFPGLGSLLSSSADVGLSSIASGTAAEACSKSELCSRPNGHTGRHDTKIGGGRRVTVIDCPVNDPDCLGADGECHDACERPG